MTGEEHYKLAEELLAEVTNDDGSVSFGDGAEECVAVAQVHATLALASMSKAVHGTSGGVELTDELIERLAREAKEGYGVEQLRFRSERDRHSVHLR